jgi:acetolactate synthase-1/3 small subunit
VLDYTNTRLILRELLLVKVSILGPEYLEEQLVGGPSHSPRRERWHDVTQDRSDSQHQTKLDREIALAQSFEHSGQPVHRSPTSDPDTITPSEALRRKHQHLQSIATLASQFGAKIVDVSENSVIVEMTGKSSRVEAFLSMVKPFGVLESARTGDVNFHSVVCTILTLTIKGLMVMPRTPIASDAEDDTAEVSEGVDASLLPPG